MDRFVKIGIALFLTVSAPLVRALDIYETPPDEGTNFAYLIVNGIIERNDSRKLAHLLEKYNKRGTSVAILLTSPGGGLEETPLIASAVLKSSQALYQKFGGHNVVAINEECSSACNILVAQLTHGMEPDTLEILATNSSRWGFHSPVLRRGLHTVAIADVKELERQAAKELSYYRDAGVNTSWLESHNDVFHAAQVVYYAAEKLCTDDEGILPPPSCVPDQDITELVSSRFKLAESVKSPAPLKSTTPSPAESTPAK